MGNHGGHRERTGWYFVGLIPLYLAPPLHSSCKECRSLEGMTNPGLPSPPPAPCVVTETQASSQLAAHTHTQLLSVHPPFPSVLIFVSHLPFFSSPVE